MTADEFVETLNQCAPSIEEMQSHDYSEYYAKERRKSYLIEIKDEGARDSNPVFDLVRRYDVTEIEFATVHFDETIDEFYHGLGFAWEEGDPIVVHRETGEILVEELGTRGYILYECARDASSFLEALAYFACKMRIGPDAIKEEVTEIAQECGRRAGGEKYVPFFQYLLPHNEDV